jgi:putative transposase
MPRKRHKPEEIVAKLRQVDVLVSRGQRVADAARAIGVTEVTYYGIYSSLRSLGPERG